MNQVEYTFSDSEDNFDVQAIGRTGRVGYAWGIRDGDRIKLMDIHVEGGSPGIHGQGIGSELLKRFLTEANAADVHEVWGCVVKSDLDNFPSLLDWYAKHGFVALEPDAECIEDAVKKVVRRMR